MVWHVRLLSEPRFALNFTGDLSQLGTQAPIGGVLSISFPVTLNTDLSDSFYPAPASIYVQVLRLDRNGDEHVYGPVHLLQWRGTREKTRVIKAQIQQNVLATSTALMYAVEETGHLNKVESLALKVYASHPDRDSTVQKEPSPLVYASTPEFLDVWTVPFQLDIKRTISSEEKFDKRTGIKIHTSYEGAYWLQRRIPIPPELVHTSALNTNTVDPAISPSSEANQARRCELNEEFQVKEQPDVKLSGECPSEDIRLLEEAGESMARHVWDGGIAMVYEIIAALKTSKKAATHNDIAPRSHGVLLSAVNISSASSSDRGPSILEIGAGCGTVGLALSKLLPASQVLLTDLPEALQIMEANIQTLGIGARTETKIECMELDWFDVVDDTAQTINRLHSSILGQSLDLIVVSECTYNEDTLEVLVNTLERLTDNKNWGIDCNPTVVVSRKTRHDSEEVFFELMERHFTRHGLLQVVLPDQKKALQCAEVNIHVYHRR